MSSKEILAKSTFTEMDKNGDGKVSVMLTKKTCLAVKKVLGFGGSLIFRQTSLKRFFDIVVRCIQGVPKKV